MANPTWTKTLAQVKPYVFKVFTPRGSGTGFQIAYRQVSGFCAVATFTIGKKLCGVVSAYIPNRATGEALPGVCVIRSVAPYRGMLQSLKSLEEAREKAEQENSEKAQKEAEETAQAKTITKKRPSKKKTVKKKTRRKKAKKI